MARLKALMLAGGALIALSRAAVAADLLPPAPALEPPPPAAAEFNGWYLRGDVGLGANASTPKLADSVGEAATATDNFYNPTISASGIFDLGFGYQFNNWFRADVTEEYRGGGHFQALEVVSDTTAKDQWADF
jgi:opacity protein-like surface antigen